MDVMKETGDYRHALEAFLASSTFGVVVHDNLAQRPLVPRVVALARDGSFSVFSSRADGSAAPDSLVLDIPSGSGPLVGAALRQRMRQS